MAMPQRDDTIEAIKRLDALLEYAVMHGDETERIREERSGGCVGFAEGRRPKGRPPYRREDECGIILNKEERPWQRSWRKSLTSVRKATQCVANLRRTGRWVRLVIKHLAEVRYDT